MEKVTIFCEIDFGTLRQAPCENCGKPFEEHFQPPDDADPNLADNWCPTPNGSGFTSQSFKRPKPGLRLPR